MSWEVSSMVEWKEMWQVTTWDKRFSGIDKTMQPKIIKYHYYLANELSTLESSNGDIRILYTTDKVAFTDSSNVEGNISEGEVVIIPWGGNVSIKYFKGKFVTADNRIATSNDTSLLSNKFLFYWMLSQKDVLESFYRGAGIKHPSMYKVLTMKVPVPSLAEQERIVGILDTFTASIENIKEQIAQRRKQYACLIDECFGGNYKSMMSKAEAGEMIVELLSKHGTFTRGRRFVRTDIVEEGQPCIHYGDMYTYYGLCADKAKTHLPYDFPKKMRYAETGDVVIVGAGENNEDIGVGLVWQGKEPAAVHDACYIYKTDLNPMYISYFLRSGIYHLQIKSNVVRGKICSISSDGIGRALIPIYPIEKQQKIVEMLMPFESLLSNLQEQLELRQKQYEYYRSQLLTFA